ncbi:nucleotidyltransferase family protein [Pseudomonas phoenicis]|uniref:nucleotidyltransferase family protein n=1 Tax=unclassified Pseudomonas TaxID=196821 RepID=UPI00399F9865
MRSKQLSTVCPEGAVTCAALVLAAGRGRRFGSDKRLARLGDGQTVLATTVRRAQAHFDEVWVVIAGHDDPQALALPEGVRVVRAQHADQGMGASLAAGVRAMRASQTCVLAVLLGDMPWLAADTLLRLRETATAERIVLPCHDGRRGHPVLFGRQFWPELERVGGDQGGRPVLRAHAQACLEVEVADPGIWLDIDTPDDLAGR